MFFEGGGYKSRAGCHGARTVHKTNVYKKMVCRHPSIDQEGSYVPYAHHGKPLSIYNRPPQKTC